MNLAMTPGSARLTRRLAMIAVGLVVVQLLLLQQWAPNKLLHFAFFGAVAFLIWVVTEARWPLIAWAVVVLVSVIDESQQPHFPTQRASLADVAAERAGPGDPFLVLKR